ncbi:HD domain-containing phosphohydrolase [Candidatus Xianfuyuplasma coldseepsis]|uniref:Diguanylate cyclase n=1 Tax=Candidatus Xianfuyuplasma coldseepsis TaxID=2782163 RepID=A0A7L7KPI0_9MOLU|nr:HD domain-containing phosphohydrolase [Xianfuyuplasma coldseepsis]QMS84690.1 diguanylate cyclase [Xianfuyuplasma coldseepsis]
MPTKRTLNEQNSVKFFNTSINTMDDGVGILQINRQSNMVMFDFNAVLLFRFDGLYADVEYAVHHNNIPRDFQQILQKILTSTLHREFNVEYSHIIEDVDYQFNIKPEQTNEDMITCTVFCYNKLLETEEHIDMFGDVVGSGLSMFAGSTWWHDYDKGSEYFYSSDVSPKILGIPLATNKMYQVSEFGNVRDKGRIVSELYDESIEHEIMAFRNLRDNKTDYFAARTPVVTKDDKIVWVEAYGKCLLRYPDGTPRFVIAIDIYLTDIYEEKIQLELITSLIDKGLINSNVGIWYHQRHYLEGKYYFTKSYQTLMSSERTYKDETITDILDDQIKRMKADGRGYEKYLHEFRSLHNSIYMDGIDKYKIVIPNYKDANTFNWIEIRGTVIERDDEGHVLLFVGVNVDVTESFLRNRELERLRIMNERLTLAENLAVQTRGLMVWYHEIEPSQFNQRIYGNEMFQRQLGVKRTDDGNIDLHQLWHTLLNDSPEAIQMNQELKQRFNDIYRNKISSFQNIVAKHKNMDTGEIKYIEHSCEIAEYHTDGSIKLLGGILLDVTKQVLNQQRIQYLADYDTLSDLYNRNYFERYIDERLPDTYSILIFDLDGLKLINDAFGHIEGDRIIKQLAQFLKNTFSDALFIARIGGDEFAVLTEDVDFDRVTDKANQLEAAIDAFNNESDIEMNVSKGGKQVINNDLTFERAFIQAENIMYRRKLNNRSSRKSKVLESLMETLNGITGETKEHCERVSTLAEQTMRGLHRIRSSEIEDINLLGMVHDIGKITIPDGLLNKPGKLTDSEFEIVKKHSEAGYKIIRNITSSDDVCDGVLFHHERFDGGGYPQGLKGEDIPIFARVIAVVDAYDAMTHDRIYHQKMSQEKAVQELLKNSGTQFDPQVVHAFLKHCLNIEPKSD